MQLISKLIIGSAQFGLPYGINNTTNQKVPQVEVSKILLTAKENGINRLDTSYAYGDSEIILGELLENDFFFKITSKLPRITKTPKLIFQETLERLKKNRIYGYLVHHFEYFRENPDIWTYLKVLKDEKLVEKIGFSLYHPSELDYLFLQDIDFNIIQFPYNILDRAFEPYLEELKKRNIEVHVRSVFLQGLFFKPVHRLNDKLMPLSIYLQEISEFCKKENIGIEELALNGIIHNDCIDGVLMGIDNVVQLQNNINGIWKELPKKVQEFITHLEVKEKEFLNPINWN
jgi:aryl-alcohol dehydrogenase-like predicted oxidoreductase